MEDLFGDFRTPWTQSTEDIFKKMLELPINWVGNKKKLLKPILKFIHDCKVEYESVFDAFSGSGVFSLAMLGEGKRVVANDAMLVSSTWLLNLLERRGNPLSQGEAVAVTAAEPSSGRHNLDFMAKKYGKVFSPDELECLETYRSAVARLLGSEMARGREHPMGEATWPLGAGQRGDPMKAAFAMQAMCVQILQKCFMGGRYYNGQTLARLDQRSDRGHILDGLNTKAISGNGTLPFLTQSSYPTLVTADLLSMVIPSPSASVYNMDAVSLAGSGCFEADLAYFDPPYGGDSSDYSMMYGACEGFLRGMPVEDCKELSDAMSRFKGKAGYAEDFKALLDASRDFPSWLFSFNESSFASADEIVALIRSFGRDVVIRGVKDYGYNYRKSSRKKESEFMILARKGK